MARPSSGLRAASRIAGAHPLVADGPAGARALRRQLGLADTQLALFARVLAARHRRAWLAGVAIGSTADVQRLVNQQAPGTWLPIRVRRAGAELELIAKFPPR